MQEIRGGKKLRGMGAACSADGVLTRRMQKGTTQLPEVDEGLLREIELGSQPCSIITMAREGLEQKKQVVMASKQFLELTAFNFSKDSTLACIQGSLSKWDRVADATAAKLSTRVENVSYLNPSLSASGSLEFSVDLERASMGLPKTLSRVEKRPIVNDMLLLALAFDKKFFPAEGTFFLEFHTLKGMQEYFPQDLPVEAIKGCVLDAKGRVVGHVNSEDGAPFAAEDHIGSYLFEQAVSIGSPGGDGIVKHVHVLEEHLSQVLRSQWRSFQRGSSEARRYSVCQVVEVISFPLRNFHSKDPLLVILFWHYA